MTQENEKISAKCPKCGAECKDWKFTEYQNGFYQSVYCEHLTSKRLDNLLAENAKLKEMVADLESTIECAKYGL